MTIVPGTRLGPYEIVARIGAGGMGEVWRARDTRLDRSVAIKIVPPELAQRFEREAKTISQLNHPHICVLHDVGENYLVMELLDGETLADRVAKGPLPLADAIRYGIQIAGALDRAHHAGIVHRDLKPGNIMITKTGAKLLDFGLAKNIASAVTVDGPTVQKDLTAEGTIVGTFQYMAPEQLEGADADARTDIFALGAVLYEMVTGRRAFMGKTRTSLIAAIVAGTPAPIREAQPLAPSALDHVITTCIEKDPDKRWQSARDVANELTWIAGAATEPGAVRKASRVWPIIAVVLALLAIGEAVKLLLDRAAPQAQQALSILPPRGQGFEGAVVIAPDGRSVAFAAYGDGGFSIWVRRLGESTATKIATVERYVQLFWSPDSKRLGYLNAGKIMIVPASGGQPDVIATYGGYGVGAAWSRRGQILFAPKFGEGLYRVAATGDEPVRVTSLDTRRGETLHGHPVFLDDGERFLYLVHTTGEARNEIWAASIGGGERKRILDADALEGVWNGWLLAVRNGALFAQRFDAKTLAVSGEPRKIADDVFYDEGRCTAFTSVSDDGAIVYRPWQSVAYDFGWYDDSGRLLQKLFTQEAANGNFELAPDDSAVALEVSDRRKGAKDIVVRDLSRGVVTRITSGLANNIQLAWAPDRSRIFYSSDRNGLFDIYAQSDDGMSVAQPVWTGGDDKYPCSVSPDGKTLLAFRMTAKTREDLWIVPLDGGAPRPWIVTPESEIQARFSPDGTWAAYSSNRSGRWEVYVAPFPDGRSIQVSTEGGSGPVWNRDASRLFYGNGRTIYAVTVKRNGKTAEIGASVAISTSPQSLRDCVRSMTAERFLCETVADPRDTVRVANYLKGW